jgi:deazaflavin-dependent oxidoreductase (nitroreductase family)
MTGNEEVYDNPTGWVNQHIQEYIQTGGEKGHEWRKGVPTLLLTTRGRKSGKLRRTALIYSRDGGNYVIVASVGGRPTHPNWYLNLVEHPEVQVQVMDRIFNARARTASGEEKARLWKMMVEIWPDYDNYQAKTEREIPVVVLEPLS